MNRVLGIIVLIITGFYSPALGETPEEKGLAIAVEDDKRDNGFVDYQANMQMILKNRHGEQSVRYIRSKNLEVQGDGDKSLVVFNKPRDVKGTALLNFTHKTGVDDQWLFLPALKRVKRISSANKSGSFMGSEFAYEDVTSQEVEKYTYKAMKRMKGWNVSFSSDTRLIRIPDTPGRWCGWIKKSTVC
jgi:hypothetical protein